MNEHEGYMELGLVGFTDKGDYEPGTTYVTNDLVHLNNAIWRCLQDNTVGVSPEENEHWSVFVASENDLSGITALDEHGILGEESAQVQAADLVNALAAPTFDDSGTAEEISGFQAFIDSVKTGTKILDFFRNLKSGLKFVLHAGQLVNNGLCNEPGKYPLDAAYGKVLFDLISKCQEDISTLNSVQIKIVKDEWFTTTSKTSGTITITEDGLYLLVFNHQVHGAATAAYINRILINNDAVTSANANAPQYNASLMIIAELHNNDTVEFTSTWGIEGSPYSKYQVIKVGDL